MFSGPLYRSGSAVGGYVPAKTEPGVLLRELELRRITDVVEPELLADKVPARPGRMT